MKIILDVDPQHAQDFFEYLDEVRSRSATELLAMQRQAEIDKQTGVIVVLGQLSRAFYDQLHAERPNVTAKARARWDAKPELRPIGLAA